MVTSYEKAAAYLGNKSDRPYGNNTRIIRRDDKTIAIRLHATDVVTFKEDGRIILDSGGWLSVTTKARMNDALSGIGFVYSLRGLWSLTVAGKSYTYRDGITIKGERVTHAGPPAPVAAKKQNKQKAQIKAYATAFIAELEAGNVPKPSGGDCWFCAMREVKSDKPLGEVTRDAGHIREHIRESYYVPSLLVNALESVGASPICKGWIGSIWHGKPEGGFIADHGRAEATKVLVKYLARQLGGLTVKGASGTPAGYYGYA